MESQTLSPKYQVVIPKPIRERVNLQPGQQFQVIEYDGGIRLVPHASLNYLPPASTLSLSVNNLVGLHS